MAKKRNAEAAAHGGPDHDHGEKHFAERCHHTHHRPQPHTPITRCRDIYLKIEKLPAYSPVAPDDAEHERYRLDCLRNKKNMSAPIFQMPRSSADASMRWCIESISIRTTQFSRPTRWCRLTSMNRYPSVASQVRSSMPLFIRVCNAAKCLV